MRHIRRFFQQIHKNRPLRWIGILFASGVIGVGVLLLTIYVSAYLLGAPPLTTAQNTVYYSANGTKIGEEHNIENRYWVELDQIEPMLIEATVQAEDQHFYDHNGFDYKRILAALLVDIRTGSKREGASTITQQYARNLYLSHDKTWARKIKEAFYTVRLELFYDKDELLEGYLNTIYYGHGAYGIEAASRYFFDKGSNDLSLAEATLLAGIPNGPSYYSPIYNFENAKKRQKRILSVLEEKEVISEQSAYLAEREAITVNEAAPTTVDSIAPYFQDIVLAEMEEILDEDRASIRTAGYNVYTTLKAPHQEELKKSIENRIEDTSELQVGSIAMNPTNGAITGMIGGRDYTESPYNRAVQAKRMVGSAFKPILYYTALTYGYTPATTLISKPTNFLLADGTSYHPSNYNGYYADRPVTLAQALAVSDNIYAMKTHIFLKPKRLINTAREFGITSRLDPVPSLALGTASVNVKEMVTAYSMLANGGKSVDPYMIEKITDADGKVLYEHKASEQKQVLDAQQTFILNQLMTGMFDPTLSGYMHVTGDSIAHRLEHTYAGKSGTTESDNWMIGYSPKLVMGIWTGYDDNSPVEKVADRTAAKQIWADFIISAHDGDAVQNFPVPSGIIAAYIDPTSGELSTPYCEKSKLMYFVKGTEPTEYCSLHWPED
ncbi:penicillin-binding protein 2D [Paraliobacillus quinghaiensis]|uniref:Penicillin-binding protein 2D n=1 Tax=Paraliobacillus quinghaiensis TaxID=470815 RepID=A0A917TQ30_9BACI|nr:PBP1A family penicillin-binding protein [Paraliobacillus quinghaiensis]GGM32866.1 penicillin-binding protein 2D [Paraliobacillus quinghaiensis]